MKNIFAEYNEADSLYITSYGMEDVSKNAHWGKGSRNAYILHYVYSGEGYYNGVKVKEGQGFLIKPGDVHEYMSSAKKPWKYFWVILNGDDAWKIFRKYISFDSRGIFDYDFKSDLKTFIPGFFETYKTISCAKANGVFWMLMSCHETKEKTVANNYVVEAKKYMEQNCYRPLSICEVSEMLHISDRYMYNLFVKYEGIAPKKYLNNLKLQRACNMLKNSVMSITEISVSVGFEDVLTFSRFFKKNKSLSPTEYRNKYNIHK